MISSKIYFLFIISLTHQIQERGVITILYENKCDEFE